MGKSSARRKVAKGKPEDLNFSLTELFAAAQNNTSSLDEIVEAVVKAFNIAAQDIEGRIQTQKFARPRHAIAWLGRVRREPFSFPQISKRINRDHTTVMSGYHRAQALLERDKEFLKSVGAALGNLDEEWKEKISAKNNPSREQEESVPSNERETMQELATSQPATPEPDKATVKKPRWKSSSQKTGAPAEKSPFRIYLEKEEIEPFSPVDLS